MRRWAWARQLSQRPVTGRRGALVIVVVLLAASAALLIASRPSQQPPAPQIEASALAGRARPPAASDPPAANVAPAGPVAARVAQRFLAGYLAYVYGHAPAAALTGAAPALVRSLRAHPSLVPPAMRALHPRLLTLRPAAGRAGTIALDALINGGELVDYTVELLLERDGRRLLIKAVEGAG
ncbi:MAG TPA: hypothetical protein VMF09_11720 [Solirubrobacteraceae bacterium]|nr:hypothetical protein [Solirubrobacteraceae bacterium]